MMKAISLAAENDSLSIARPGQLLGDPETPCGSAGGGRFAVQLLDYARSGKLKTVLNQHERYGEAALVDADAMAAFIAETGIGRGTIVDGWCRLKGSFAATQGPRNE